MTIQAKFRFRIYSDAVVAIGPGKVDLLEAIARAGSISGAAREMKMSYRRAWLLVEELNNALAQPAVATVTGGAQGGGARLTATGERIVQRYRAIEATASRAAADDIAALTRMLKRG